MHFTPLLLLPHQPQAKQKEVQRKPHSLEVHKLSNRVKRHHLCPVSRSRVVSHIYNAAKMPIRKKKMYACKTIHSLLRSLILRQKRNETRRADIDFALKMEAYIFLQRRDFLKFLAKILYSNTSPVHSCIPQAHECPILVTLCLSCRIDHCFGLRFGHVLRHRGVM